LLNFAIIGCGAIGSRHAENCSVFGKLIAVCDVMEEKAFRLGEKYNAKTYSQAEDMLNLEKNVDVIAICTPNGLHAQHTIQSLKAGFHVICEKPMALFTSDCEKMIRVAEEVNRQLFIVKQNRFNPPVIAVKQMLEEGKLGDIYSVQVNGFWNRGMAYYKDSWHGTREMDGGILYTQFSHFIDLLYWMIGEVKEVHAYKNNFAHKSCTGFEDAVVACLRFDGGPIASLHFTVNSYAKNMEGSFTLVAEKGTVKIGGQYLNTLEYLDAESDGPYKLSPGNPANDYGTYQGSMSNHDKMYGHVIEVIEKGCPNRFSGYEGLKTLDIIEKIYKAAK
jgi:UDP-N-acetyl-2-amino-2-deoxyglucuronate dehydrogenase